MARAVVKLAGLTPGDEIDRGGKTKLDAKLPGYNAAAAHGPWLVLRDLDHDETCAGRLVTRLVKEPGRFLCLRIAVRAVETWLMADAERLASFIHVPKTRIPHEPDKLDDPKVTLVNIARGSRKPDIVRDMVPREGASRKIGPGYEGRISDFAQEHWRADVARASSPSLDRCIRALERLRSVLHTSEE